MSMKKFLSMLLVFAAALTIISAASAEDAIKVS